MKTKKKERKINLRVFEVFERGQSIFEAACRLRKRKMYFVEVTNPEWRRLFDEALDLLHYAGACQRVGRCMRLAIIHERQWVGGIVLGSTFPNIDVRDRALGLKKFVKGFKSRGLGNPWARENQLYWKALQRVVNHARTFIFPMFQGKGLATLAHSLLLKEGVELWQKKYGDQVYALDNLCDHGDSKLFAKNGWTLVGETKGYRSDRKSVFSHRFVKHRLKMVRNNVGLQRWPDGRRWLVWIKLINPRALKDLELGLHAQLSSET